MIYEGVLREIDRGREVGTERERRTGWNGLESLDLGGENFKKKTRISVW